MTNKVTGISFVHTSEGLRVVYSYSTIDNDGKIINSNQRGNFINMESSTEDFISNLETKILERIKE